MPYVMEDIREAERLEEQARNKGYLISDELADLRLSPGARVLDAGCGTGLVARYLYKHYRGLTVEGCDASELRLEQAKTLATKDRAPVRYFVSQVQAIDAPPSQYDAVVCRYVFEHIQNHQAAANEFFRVIKPDGQVI